MTSFFKVTLLCTFSTVLFSGCVSEHFFSVLEAQVSKKSPQTVSPHTNPPYLTPGTKPGEPSCNETLQTTTQNLRIIFMIDISGSTDTTDPDKTYRLRNLRTFLAKFGPKKNLSYSLGVFAGSAKVYDVSLGGFVDPNSVQIPFGTAAHLSQAIEDFKDLPSEERTAYKVAFDSVESIISHDITAPNNQNYITVFMTDGAPTDLVAIKDHRTKSCSLETTQDQIVAGLVRSLKTTVTRNHDGLVTVSSVYFGGESTRTGCDAWENYDPWWAIQHVKTIAREGNGQFVDTNIDGKEIEISDIITIPSTNCTSK